MRYYTTKCWCISSAPAPESKVDKPVDDWRIYYKEIEAWQTEWEDRVEEHYRLNPECWANKYHSTGSTLLVHGD